MLATYFFRNVRAKGAHGRARRGYGVNRNLLICFETLRYDDHILAVWGDCGPRYHIETLGRQLAYVCPIQVGGKKTPAMRMRLRDRRVTAIEVRPGKNDCLIVGRVRVCNSLSVWRECGTCFFAILCIRQSCRNARIYTNSVNK